MKISKRELLEEILLNQKFIMHALTDNYTKSWDDDSLEDIRVRIAETAEAVRLSRQ